MKLAILIVTHNSEDTIELVLNKLPNRDGVFVLDNASSDETITKLDKFPELTVVSSQSNMGFCAGNNLILNRAYKLSYTHFLFLNPDAAPLPGAIDSLLDAAKDTDSIAYTPKILRADNSIEPLDPPVIDAAGIYFTPNFRHLDRGSGERDTGQFETREFVSGGTGAALLVSRNFVEKVSFISPTTGDFEFFDERFFAYREDAELALRALRYGLKYLYVPSSVFCHLRNVLPERRNELSSFINALSIRNRLLLLLSHYSLSLPLLTQVKTQIRNLAVFGYAFLFEPESRKLVLQSLSSWGTHIRRRREISLKSATSPSEYGKIFR